MGTKGAQSLLRTFELRDNLMHPRSVEGFTVDNEQMQEAIESISWYKKQFNAVLSPLDEEVKKLSKY